VTGGLEERKEVSIGGVDGRDTRGRRSLKEGCQGKCGRISGKSLLCLAKVVPTINKTVSGCLTRGSIGCVN